MVPVSPVRATSPCSPLRCLAIYPVTLQVSFRRANLKVLDLKVSQSVFQQGRAPCLFIRLSAPILRVGLLNGSFVPVVCTYPGDGLTRPCTIHTLQRHLNKSEPGRSCEGTQACARQSHIVSLVLEGLELRSSCVDRASLSCSLWQRPDVERVSHTIEPLHGIGGGRPFF